MLRIDLFCCVIFGIFIFYKCDRDCNELETGTFVLKENANEIGTIYRKNGIQIETYTGSSKHVVVDYINKDDCIFYIRSNKIESDIDTLTWILFYRKLSTNKFHFIAKPLYYKDVLYKYEGELVKISDKIANEKVKNIFLEFNISTE